MPVEAVIHQPDSPCVNDRKYPYLGHRVSDDTVVYFTKHQTGACVHSSYAYLVGSISDGWPEYAFGYMFGSITLQNETLV